MATRARYRRSAERRSPRLTGFDYSEHGSYFVTACSAGRRYLFGSVAGGNVVLTPLGEIVWECLKAIPLHFPNARLGAYQVMPNHVHAIIDILHKTKNKKRSVGVEYIQPLHAAEERNTRWNGFQHLQPGSLSSIVRAFKAAVSRESHRADITHSAIWQRSFHDRIIRDDIEYYFIERYISLNPLLWHLDDNNPSSSTESRQKLRREMCKCCHVTEDEAGRVIDAMGIA